MVVRLHQATNYLLIMFHTVRPRGKNDIKLKDCYRSCVHSVVLSYDVKSITFYCVATGICGFVALATVRIWLELNHSSADPVIFCTYENADYFPVSEIHLTDNYMKESSNNDCIVNVTNCDGLRRCDQNRKVPGSNPARRSAGLRDPTSLRGSR